MKKRNQHYVWKHYLKPWTMNGKLFCLRDGKIFEANPDRIASKRDFYRLKKLTDSEVLFITGMVNQMPSAYREVRLGWLVLFYSIVKSKKHYESLGIKCEKTERQLDVEINNFEENLHSSVEFLGMPYIEKLLKNDLSFWEEEPSRGKFAYFLGVQYFRTNNMRKRVVDNSARFNSNLPEAWTDFVFDMEKAYGVLSHIFATNVGDALADMKIGLLKNTSGVPLITADQPAINLKNNGNGIDIAPTMFELYYPLSPKAAITIFQDKESLFSGNLCENDVVKLNDTIAGASLEQIYANEQGVLERYLERN